MIVKNQSSSRERIMVGKMRRDREDMILMAILIQSQEMINIKGKRKDLVGTTMITGKTRKDRENMTMMMR